MDTGDWRYGRGSDDAPWTEPSTGSSPTPDLWADEESDTSSWTPSPSWRPRHQADPNDSSPTSPSPIGSAPTSPSATRNGSFGSPVTGFPSGGYPVPGFGSGYAAAHPAPRYGAPGPSASEPPTYGGSTYGGSTYGESPYGGTSYGGTTLGGSTYGDDSATAYGSAPSSGAGYGSAPSSGAAYGASLGAAPSSGAAYGTAGRTPYGAAPSYASSPSFGQAARRTATVAPRPAASGRRDSGDEPDGGGGYWRVFGYTAIWYAGPLVLYLLWLVIFGGDREAVAGRQFVDGIPWMLGAVVISGGLALLLRRITVGWGTVGVSFAATVIGAGLATIVHSFA